MTGLQLLVELSNATSDNIEMGASTISLYPQSLEGGSFSKDTKTAGLA